MYGKICRLGTAVRSGASVEGCLAERRTQDAGTEAEQCTMMVKSNKQTDQEGTVFINLVSQPQNWEEHSAAEIPKISDTLECRV